MKSVKNSRQITKAMELVAASKMKRAQQSALTGRPYANLMSDMLASIAVRVDGSLHPFLVERPVRTRGILLVTSDKGLCGPLNGNLFKLVADIRSPVKFFAVGRRGAQFLARTRRDLVADFPVHDQVPYAEAKVIGEFMVKQFLGGAVDTIEIIYSRFRNTLFQEPRLRPIFPLKSLKHFISNLSDETAGSRAVSSDGREIMFEPDVDGVLAALLPYYVNRQIHQHLLSAKASEHSARMVAMKTAKDNATKLLGDLTLEYNKARQAAITQEILEIASAQYAAG
ncbi:MAG: ATP synthase F1 subunit gamma [Opitutaceae bacterium]